VPHKWYDKGSTITLRFQAPVTTIEPETLTLLWQSGTV